MAKFQPGQSGNPSGRPKVVARVRDLAREYTEEAIEALVAEMRDSKGSARVTAAMAILDRGYGKPTQHIEANVNLLDQLTADDLAIVEEALSTICGEAACGDTSALN